MEGSSQIESLLMLGAVTADGNSTLRTLGSSELVTTLWPGTATHSEEINTESPCRQERFLPSWIWVCDCLNCPCLTGDTSDTPTRRSGRKGRDVVLGLQG